MASPHLNTTSTTTIVGHPTLLSTNLKFRHLHGITLRNLDLSHSNANPARLRGKSIDDEALPYALKSPPVAKSVAAVKAREHRLSHSRSEADLRPISEVAVDERAVEGVSSGSVVRDGEGLAEGTGTDVGLRGDIVNVKTNGDLQATNMTKGMNGPPKTLSRPAFSRMRRRSTMEWANASPLKRQEKLEAVSAEQMADVFFSVHVVDFAEPVYVSEVVEKTMNPTFRNIDLSACGPGITRLDTLTVCFWVRSEKVGHWQQLLELSLHLGGLKYIGKALENLHHPLPQNAVIFHLTDGIYIDPTQLPGTESAQPPYRAGTKNVLLTSSFDALLRLSKLDDSIQDALLTRDKLAADLDSLLQSNKSALADRDHVSEAHDHLKTVNYAAATVQKQIDKARVQLTEKRASLATRRSLMAQDKTSRAAMTKEMHSLGPFIEKLNSSLAQTTRNIAEQRRRVCRDLQTIYPISPLPNQSLAFTIAGLHIPNSESLDSTTTTPETIAAALGNVANVLQLLSFYLSQPLPYPVHPRGSTSTITDPISMLKASTTAASSTKSDLRTYPLFSKGVPRFRFDYAVFLLRKDIEVLLAKGYGVRVLDIRQTLPNLLWLDVVATAGEGEVVGRRRGGVKGLGLFWTDGGGGGDQRDDKGHSLTTRPGANRTDSTDSSSSALSGLLWHQGRTAGTNGTENESNGSIKTNGAVQSLKRDLRRRLDG